MDKKTELSLQIEAKRQELQNAVKRRSDLRNKEVLRLSVELDSLLNEYSRLRARVS